MRLLGIDYGSKRVGIALSDSEGLMGFPHAVLQNNEELSDALLDVIEREEVSRIVIGHSLNRVGGENPIHKEVKAFIDLLKEKTDLPIDLEPEQYTTQEATRFQEKNERTDASAAAIILNSYITRTQQQTRKT